MSETRPEEYTPAEAGVVHNNTDMQNLPMLLEQAPIIREKLRPLREQVEREVSEALSLVCTEETVKTVKAKRAELNKKLQHLEDQRKAIKQGVMGPYNAFEAVFKECVSDAYKTADAQLKGKIDAVEQEIKQRCEDGLRGYFEELCAAYHLHWLQFERTGITVDMASAKQKTPKKLREQLSTFVNQVSDAVTTISAMEDADEVMVEFKRTLDLAQALGTVQDRRRRIEQERLDQETYAASAAQDREAVRRVKAVAPPVAVSEMETPARKVLTATFTAHGTREQLIKLREFMKQEGIKYE